MTVSQPTRSLTLKVAEDAYRGDAQFNVFVDGAQVGGTQTATASHAAGAWQDVTLTGTFSSTPRSVEVRFLNDAWGGSPGSDRNLYVDHLVLGTTTYQAEAAANSAGSAVGQAAGLYSAGSLVFDTTKAPAAATAAPTASATAAAPAPAATTPAAATLTLRVAEDAYRGDAQFNVFVDGAQVGGTQTATASHAAGAWQDVTLTGTFSSTPRSVEVRFLNDAWGGSPGSDRNLYVDHLVLGTTTYQGEAAANSAGSAVGDAAGLYAAGSLVFDTTKAPAATTPALAATTVTAVTAPTPVLTTPVVTTPVVSTPVVTTPVASRSSAPGLSLLGVNLAGADFSAGKLPGVFGTDYTYPTHAEVDYYAAKGLGVIRLPFLWERLQPTQGGALNASELGRIDDVVSYATAKGLKVVLDPHDYGSGYGHVIGSAQTPNSAFADFWGRLAGHFAGNANVMFGLMNEPNKQDATQWLASANAAIGAIRASGATRQEILVPGSYWDGAHSWVSSDNDTTVGNGIVDPSRNYAFEVHQYLDGDSSGTSADVVSATIGVDRLTAVTQWAESTGNRLFLGEFGVSQDAASLKAMDNMLAYMDQHAVWQGATYWAAGPWWGDYMYSIEPAGLGTAHVTDKPQMDVLEKFITT
ncbi:cellulase family glycosylhydrolase [Methylobacterium crusticola]|nr:cellulase family glycosylhydrolase [Methylobacterium crusticola]